MPGSGCHGMELSGMGAAFCGCHPRSAGGSSCAPAARTRITDPPQDQSVIKGTKAVMSCGVTHDPSVDVR